MTEAERRYRDQHPQLPRLRPAYAHVLELGRRCQGREGAQFMVDQIQRLLDHRHWTDSEARMLYVARDKWQRRVDGRDARYIFTAGKVRGRLKPQVQADVTTYQILIDIEDALRAALQDYQTMIPHSPSPAPVAEAS